MLTLPIKKKWFDMLKSGEKKEEYREIKPYWATRFAPYLKENKPFEVLFRNGYGKDKPTIKCLVEIDINYGHSNWGADIGETYFVLKILKVGDYNESRKSCC